MKSVLVLALIIAYCSLPVSAQIYKGDWTLGGGLNANLTRSDQKESRRFDTSLRLGGGYFITDGLNIGLHGRTYFSRTKQQGILQDKSTTVSFGPSISYYYLLSDKIYWLNEFDYSRRINRYTYEDRFSDDSEGVQYKTSRSTEASIGATTAAGYFINKIWGLQATLHYTPYRWYNRDEYSQQSSDLSFSVGLRYFISVRMGNQ